MLWHADDCLLLSATAKDMQNDFNATLGCCENNMCIKTGKTKYIVLSRAKIRKYDAITAYGQTIERVDTFCYLAIVFRYNKPQ